MITRAVLFERFIGRRDELDFLVELRTRSARLGTGGAVVIAGEAGMGKSRLLTEFRKATARERGTFVYVRGHERGARPYGAFIDALEEFERVRQLQGRPSLEDVRSALTIEDLTGALPPEEQSRVLARAHSRR